MITAAQIRERFPRPVSAGSSHGCWDYCVGGAVCQFAGYGIRDFRFPSPKTLASVLSDEFGIRGTYDKCLEIIANNDRGNFDRAWELLDEALKYGKDSQ